MSAIQNKSDTKPFHYIKERNSKKEVMRTLLKFAQEKIEEFKEDCLRENTSNRSVALSLKDDDFVSMWFNCYLEDAIEYECLERVTLDLDPSDYVQQYGLMDALQLVPANSRNSAVYSNLLMLIIRDAWECREKKEESDRRKKIKPITPLLQMFVDGRDN